jgi:hypothetical protein
MLELGPAAQIRALATAQAIGADTIRANVIWARIAPRPNSKRKPRRFKGRNPGAYSAVKWAPLDGLVAGAQARGLQVLLTPTGPAPAWASRCKGSVRKRHTCKPNPRLFGDFVRALGRRYPQVTRWSLWNEPNQPGWLSPQYERHGGRVVPVAADLYRSLARSGIAALRATGHRRNQILLGETSPIGRTAGPLGKRAIAPVPFLDELLCLRHSCGHFRRLRVTGYAHHPYTRGGSRPPRSRTLPGEVTIGNARRLERVLDRAGRHHRIPKRLSVYYTENGWQSNPPDRIFGVTPAQQAQYINESDWIAYRDKRVRAVAQYKLIDDADPASFQSGLFFVNRRAKPALAAYRLPIWVVRHGRHVTVYGQVRPAADGAAGTVAVQHATAATGPFSTVASVSDTSLKGQFTVNVPVTGGFWRLVWSRFTSRVAVPARR